MVIAFLQWDGGKNMQFEIMVQNKAIDKFSISYQWSPMKTEAFRQSFIGLSQHEVSSI
jgi:hypothetical protein